MRLVLALLIIPNFLYSVYNQERIELKAERGGAPCAGNSTRNCDLGPCPIDCQWSDWSPCNYSSCGNETQHRTVIQKAENGGKPCEGNDIQTCDLEPCPVDCQLSDWSPCEVA